jgi:hypothetical protein
VKEYAGFARNYDAFWSISPFSKWKAGFGALGGCTTFFGFRLDPTIMTSKVQSNIEINFKLERKRCKQEY